MTIFIRLCGFLFLFILVLNFAMSAFGNKIELDKYNSNVKLQKINDNPTKFKVSILLGLIEHGSIIALAIMLFIVFSPYNIILGIVWTIFRTGEGLVFIYNEVNYWGLLKIANNTQLLVMLKKNR